MSKRFTNLALVLTKLIKFFTSNKCNPSVYLVKETDSKIIFNTQVTHWRGCYDNLGNANKKREESVVI